MYFPKEWVLPLLATSISLLFPAGNTTRTEIKYLYCSALVMKVPLYMYMWASKIKYYFVLKTN
jgi:hypothetical protein